GANLGRGRVRHKAPYDRRDQARDERGPMVRSSRSLPATRACRTGSTRCGRPEPRPRGTCASTPLAIRLRGRDSALNRFHGIRSLPGGSTARRTMNRSGILSGWLLCAVLDITAACVQARLQAGFTPARVLKGVASALWGPAALNGGAGMAAIGLVMHFAVALTATLVFAALASRIAALRTAPLWIIGPLYGAVVFCAMNYG